MQKITQSDHHIGNQLKNRQLYRVIISFLLRAQPLANEI